MDERTSNGSGTLLRAVRRLAAPAVLVILYAVTVTGVFASSAAAGTSAEKLDAILASHRSPMTGMGAVFMTQGQANGVDPAFLVAIAGAESSFGRFLYAKDGDVATFNAFNWFYGPTWPQSDFTSWDEAITRVAAGLAGGLYHGAGLYGVLEIAPRYCPDGTAEWITNVTAFLTELGGDPQDTRLSVMHGPPETQPGLLELKGKVGLRAAKRHVGQAVKAEFTVINSGGETLHLDGMTLAVRSSGGSGLDLVSRSVITLEPGEERVVLARWPLDQAGTWHGWIQVEQQGTVSLVGDAEAFKFTVKLPRDVQLRRWNLREQRLHLSNR